MNQQYFSVFDGRLYRASRNTKTKDPRKKWSRVSMYMVPDITQSAFTDVSEPSEGLLAKYVKERKRDSQALVDEVVDRVNDENRKYARFPGKRLYVSSVTGSDRTMFSDVAVVVETDLPEEMVWEYTRVFDHWFHDQVWKITDVSKNVLEKAVYAYTPQEALERYFKRLELLGTRVA